MYDTMLLITGSTFFYLACAALNRFPSFDRTLHKSIVSKTLFYVKDSKFFPPNKVTNTKAFFTLLILKEKKATYLHADIITLLFQLLVLENLSYNFRLHETID